MSYQFSEFGRHLGMGSGIEELMDDLGHALASDSPNLKMLGGGQPARIPEVNTVWRRRMEEILAESAGLDRAITSYDPPRGNPRFLDAVAKLFRHSFGWQVDPEHIAITSGAQTAFFFLFNLLAGRMDDGTRKRILLPLVPEYIGYASQGVDGTMFQAIPPRIEEIGEHEFKYRVDFDKLAITPDIAAICASRPTNPTGNVLTDNEVIRLATIAREHGIPFIIDNAYGVPFPGIIFRDDATPYWDDNTILTLSLSKIGLPGTRTGIIIGPPAIIRALGSMNAIVGLANPSIGQQITTPLIESGEILNISTQLVRPYYEQKARLARQAVHDAFTAVDAGDWRLHVTEGALFLWLWFPGLPCTAAELYQRLKAREVLVIPGHYFFFGLQERLDWPHLHECIRVSYAMDEKAVRDGLAIIAEECAAIRKGLGT